MLAFYQLTCYETRLVKLTSGQSVLSQSTHSDGRPCRCDEAIPSEQPQKNFNISNWIRRKN